MNDHNYPPKSDEEAIDDLLETYGENLVAFRLAVEFLTREFAKPEGYESFNEEQRLLLKETLDRCDDLRTIVCESEH